MVASRILCGAHNLKLWIYKGANLTWLSKVAQRTYILSEILAITRHLGLLGVPISGFPSINASVIG